MKVHPLLATAMVLVIAGGGTLYLTQPQYDQAYFCSDNVLHTGTLKGNFTLLEGNASLHCADGWVSLKAVCGKFIKGKKYALTYDRETCDTKRCYPVNCRVT